MSNPKEVIIEEIEVYIAKCGGRYSDWYAGIASDPRDRLFNDHNVDENRDFWIFREAENSSTAREIEDYFINVLGTDGGAGGGDYTTRFVYAYKKTANTVE